MMQQFTASVLLLKMKAKPFLFTANVTGNKEGLIDGMNITGIVSLDKSVTPAIPNEAIVEADGKYYVFVQTDKKAEVHEEERKTKKSKS
jgi:hypothetical protein